MEERHQLSSVGRLSDTFAAALRHAREDSRLSQSRLAAKAGFDHSYVSRLESGTRTPTRDAVVRLAAAMMLDETERDSLLAAAGFMPDRIENLLASEPIIGEILGLLQSRAVPTDVRDDLRTAVTLAVRQAQRAAPTMPSSGGSQPTVAAD